jgi:hypothetical protein
MVRKQLPKCRQQQLADTKEKRRRRRQEMAFREKCVARVVSLRITCDATSRALGFFYSAGAIFYRLFVELSMGLVCV